MKHKNEYDVIIIGAGISGLVCGCYLAKAGLKTAIIEKNPKVGGYCTSFRTKEYHFDACVHALTSLRENGLLNRILCDLEIIGRIKFNRHDPSNLVITPEFKINIFHEVDKTIDEFQRCFPKEAENIRKFFEYIGLKDSFFEIRSKTFSELLDSFFYDRKLKGILSVLALDLLGASASSLSALVVCLLLREFFFDGGYYPIGGIQVFPEALLQKFVECNGNIILGKMVKKINVKNGVADSVILNDGQLLSSRYIVSACDMRQTFFELLESAGDKTSAVIQNKINATQLSSSYFLVYLGIDKKLDNITELKSNIFLFNDYSLRENNADDSTFYHIGIRTPSLWDESLNRNNKDSICLLVDMHYKKYWHKEAQNMLSNRLVKSAESIIPDLSVHISLKTITTPLTLYNWTRNNCGAAYGWASTPQQFGNPDFSQKTIIENLYLTGHWSNQSSGISFVANCAHDTANLILQKERKE